jgi:hypothetical protein
MRRRLDPLTVAFFRQIDLALQDMAKHNRCSSTRFLAPTPIDSCLGFEQYLLAFSLPLLRNLAKKPAIGLLTHQWG